MVGLTLLQDKLQVCLLSTLCKTFKQHGESNRVQDATNTAVKIIFGRESVVKITHNVTGAFFIQSAG
jgi:hypothetical protein